MAAEHNTLASKIESIAADIVLVEPSDLPALAELHTHFQQLAELAREGGCAERFVQAAVASTDMVESLILGDVADADRVLRAVTGTVAAMQEVIRDGRDVGEVTFPPELKIDPDGDAAGGLAHPAALPCNVDEKIFGEFLTRQQTAMEEMEAMILAMEKTANEDSLLALKRLIHTLKGEAALMGLDDVERLCHITEDALGTRSTGEMIDGLLQVKDWFSQVFQACAGKGPMPASVDEVLHQIAGDVSPAGAAGTSPDAQSEGAVPGSDEPAGPVGSAEASPAPSAQAPPPSGGCGAGGTEQVDRALLEDFVCEAAEHLESADVHLLQLETDPGDTEAINAVFRAFHTIKGIAGCLGLDEIRGLAHEAESLLDRARKREVVLAGPPIDVSFEAVDAIRRMVGTLRESMAKGTEAPPDAGAPKVLEHLKAVMADPSAAPPVGEQGGRSAPARRDITLEAFDEGRRPLGEILVDRGVATPQVIEAALQNQAADEKHPPLGQVLVAEGKVPAREVAQGLRTQSAEAVNVKEIVKIDAERLDRLLDTIGELVIAESMVSQSDELRQVASPDLIRQLGLLDKITRDLQETGTSLRMVPVRATFQKMARLVRDLARKVGKPVNFVTTGEDTELDKNVVDRIGDPLVHMVRNAVDHGLEADPEQRRQAGKPEAGRVELRAFHKGGNIYIEIADDGRGLNRDALVKKAIDRGLLAPDANPTDQEVWNLVFEPGLSTAKSVTDVSGRGVGMDVVKRNIEQLRGQIEITSTLGKGTTFSIRLPLTLAIIDGMVIQVGRQRYIIPTLSIIRSVRPAREDLSTVLGRGEMLNLQGNLIPLFRLGRLFDIADACDEPTEAIVVIVEDEGHQIGLLTDGLLGQQQIVIKSLGESMQGIPGLAGGAVMPDGQVGLILDVGGLVKLAHGD